MQTWHAQQVWLGGNELVSDVLIEVDNGRISSISPGHDSDADQQLNGVVLPGLVSAHSHAFHRLLRGRTHDAGNDFWSWRTPMYTIANSLTPDSYRELATRVFSEMVAAGITTVGEFHYVHHRTDGSPYDEANAFGLAIAAAAEDSGIRLTLIDAAYLTSDVAGSPVLAEQRRFSDGSIERWRERVLALAEGVAHRPMVQMGIAAHSVRGVRAADLHTVRSTAEELRNPLHIHVSEQPAENNAVLSVHGVTPVGLLEQHGFLTKRTTLVHATHLTAEDISLISNAGSMVCFCPTTESDLGDGIGPAMELAEAGVPLCLGSDSNAIIDILREAHRLEQHDRLRLMRRSIHTPKALMTAASTSGMRSLGWDDRGLAVGGLADFIAIDAESAELSGTGGSLGAIVSSATRASVTDVVIAGVARKRS